MADASKVNIAVADRVLLHLYSHYDQLDQYMVTSDLTRNGIAQACAQHPPNVSRSMKDLLLDGLVEEHSRSIINEDRRKKAWQLTPAGYSTAKKRHTELSKVKVLLRDKEGKLLQIEAGEAAERLSTDIGLLQILLHSQYEGALTYGDIRFGLIKKKVESKDVPEPGRLVPFLGAHATYHTKAPRTRKVHGRESEIESINEWMTEKTPCLVVHGIAGIGKSTLVSHWLSLHSMKRKNLSVCWYPCHPWDKELGLATSLLHRFGVDENHDPYNLIETLPLQPGAKMNVELWYRRLLAYLTDPNAIRERFDERSGGPPPYWLIILDDVHLIEDECKELLSALLTLSTKTPLRLLMISRSTMSFYDRRDVFTRKIVSEMPLKGLKLDEVKLWLDTISSDSELDADELFGKIGGHPLALELLELYGSEVHGDWLKFLDQEILERLPEQEKNLLSTLAVSDKPVPWETLARAVDWNGSPPKNLISHGLIVELEEGMWLHEALKERLLREVGFAQELRKSSLL